MINKFLPIAVLTLSSTSAMSEDRLYYGLSLSQLEYSVKDSDDVSADLKALEATFGYHLNGNISIESSVSVGIQSDEQKESSRFFTSVEETKLQNAIQLMLNFHADATRDVRPFVKLGYTNQRFTLIDSWTEAGTGVSFRDEDNFSGDGFISSAGLNFKVSAKSSVSLAIDYAPSLDFDGVDIDGKALKISFQSNI